ncbi:hypothetical protein [Pseudoalteromonas rubra]|uniref:Uncharacterized protein n=1 Tax=Pseudoalteromonas rubra TaxID=43658 RepID=A0A0F4QSV9_9GAMM|nr:hypothetical protein [Pseudoalteromonas rubra]KJZ10763.1 hypothetical protein TW77_06935 [Pseudoalteromonas rubra]
MPVIRYRHNYGYILLTTGGLLRSTKCVNQGTVRCTDGKGNEWRLPFKGFTSELRTRHFDCVTMHDVIGITGDETGFSDWVDLRGDFVGVWCDDGVYLALNAHGRPVVDTAYKEPQKQLGQVVDLSSFRAKKSL